MTPAPPSPPDLETLAREVIAEASTFEYQRDRAARLERARDAALARATEAEARFLQQQALAEALIPKAEAAESRALAAERGLDAVGHALGICYDHDHGCGGHGPVEEMVRAAKEGCAARGDAIEAESALETMRAALRGLVLNEGAEAFGHLDRGIGTATPSGKRWLAARAALGPSPGALADSHPHKVFDPTCPSCARALWENHLTVLAELHRMRAAPDATPEDAP